jgi:hypothetical protein
MKNESLFQEVKTRLPSESVAYLGQVKQTIFIGMKACKDYPRFRETIDRINEAAVKRRVVDMISRTMGHGGEDTPPTGLPLPHHILRRQVLPHRPVSLRGEALGARLGEARRDAGARVPPGGSQAGAEGEPGRLSDVREIYMLKFCIDDAKLPRMVSG